MQNELIYGAIPDQWSQRSIEFYISNLREQGATGLIFDARISDGLVQFAERARAASLDVILLLRWWPGMDEGLIEEAKAVTRRLSLGDARSAEWCGMHGTVERYQEAAQALDFEWVCPLIHTVICRDIAEGGARRKALGDTFCICHCGYVLAGYLYADPRIPDQGWHENGTRWTTASGENLHAKFGLTVAALRDYLSPMNIISGAGWQAGLDAGSRIYARELGFNGLMVGTPFDLTGSNDVSVNEHAAHYPPRCGDFSEGYR